MLICNGGDRSREKIWDALAKHGSPYAGIGRAVFVHLKGPSTWCHSKETGQVLKTSLLPFALFAAQLCLRDLALAPTWRVGMCGGWFYCPPILRLPPALWGTARFFRDPGLASALLKILVGSESCGLLGRRAMVWGGKPSNTEVFQVFPMEPCCYNNTQERNVIRQSYLCFLQC